MRYKKTRKNWKNLAVKEFGFDWVLWHINHRGLFIAKSCLYIYIKYIECLNIHGTHVRVNNSTNDNVVFRRNLGEGIL